MKLKGVPNETAVRLDDLRVYLCKRIADSPYTQRDLAESAHVSPSSISRYTRGEIDSPSLEWIVRVFKALGISTDIILDFIY